jgi:cullin 1
MQGEEALLLYYAAEWDRYTKGAHCLNITFAYLNRCWVKPQRNEGERGVYQVYTVSPFPPLAHPSPSHRTDTYPFLCLQLAVAQWRQDVFTPLQPLLTAAILRFVAAQRDGAFVDQVLLKKVVDSFVSLGFDAADPEKRCLDVYKNQFEAPFLTATAVYYAAEAEAVLNTDGGGVGGTGNIPQYLKKVDGRLREEEEHVKQYLPAETRNKLMRCCEDVLLRKHVACMWDVFPVCGLLLYSLFTPLRCSLT